MGLGLLLCWKGSSIEPPQKCSYGHKRGPHSCADGKGGGGAKMGSSAQVPDLRVAMAVARELPGVQSWMVV